MSPKNVVVILSGSCEKNRNIFNRLRNGRRRKVMSILMELGTRSHNIKYEHRSII